MWTVREAKVKLAEILKRASKGEPQIIGVLAPCVIMSMTEFNDLTKRANTPHLGQWLVENFPRGTEFEAPSRSENRHDPFVSIGLSEGETI
jgi:prevent-host-death family protein